MPRGFVKLCPFLFFSAIAAGQVKRVVKVTLPNAQYGSLSQFLYDRWEIGTIKSPPRLYGTSGLMAIYKKIKANTGEESSVYIPVEILKPTDDATIGRLTSDFRFLPVDLLSNQRLAAPEPQNC